MEYYEFEKWKKAGQIAALLMRKAISIAKPETPLLEIAEKIEEEAEKLKVKWAFPINLSINEIAAHATPSFNDKRIAEGLLKIDLGINIDGCISDIAKSIDLTPEQKHKEMIKANENALSDAIKTSKFGVEVREIGKKIHDAITSAKFSPIRNLSGHEMKRYNLHAGLTIPNYDNGNKTKLEEGIYALEPFATTGEGIVKDSKPSGIFMLMEKKPVRDLQTRKILDFIDKEYSALPFSARWIVKKFGTSSLVRLSSMEQNGILHGFAELIEVSRMPVSQAEHTIYVKKDKNIVLTID